MLIPELPTELRQQAIKLRMDVARFNIENREWPTDDHKALAIQIASSEDWLVAFVANALLDEGPFKDPAHTSIAEELDLQGDTVGLSKVAVKDALLCRIARLQDPKPLDVLFDAYREKYTKKTSPYSSGTIKTQKDLSIARLPRFSDAIQRVVKQSMANKEPASTHSSFELPKGGLEFSDEYRICNSNKKTPSLLVNLWAEDWNNIFPMNAGHKVPGPQARRDNTNAVCAAGSVYVIIDRNQNTVATLLIQKLDETTASVGWFVLPELRGKGIAHKAAESMMSYMIEEGIETFKCQILETNAASAQVASKLGFEVGYKSDLGNDGDWSTYTVTAEDFKMARDGAIAPKL